MSSENTHANAGIETPHVVRLAGIKICALSTQNKKGAGNLPTPFGILVGRGGFEPPTNGLKVRCSTS